MDLATAVLAAQGGCSRADVNTHFENARGKLGPDAEIFELDVSSPDEVAVAFNRIGRLDYLAIPGGRPSVGTFAELLIAEARTGFDNRFWGQWLAVQEVLPRLSADGSIVLFVGEASQRPRVGEVALAAVNAAVEGFGGGLAVELAPIRVNVFSPGNVATRLWDGIPESLQEREAQNLLLERMATPEEAGSAIKFLLTNEFLIGTILHLDGGRMPAP